MSSGGPAEFEQGLMIGRTVGAVEERDAIIRWMRRAGPTTSLADFIQAIMRNDHRLGNDL